MEIKIKIEKRHAFLILSGLLVLAGAIFVFAQTQAVPNPGHDMNEIGVTDDIKIVDWGIEVTGDDSAATPATSGAYLSSVGLRVKHDTGSDLINAPLGLGVRINRAQPAVTLRNNFVDSAINNKDGAAVLIEAGKFCIGDRCLSDLSGLVVGGYQKNDVSAPFSSPSCVSGSEWGKANSNCACPAGTNEVRTFQILLTSTTGGTVGLYNSYACVID